MLVEEYKKKSYELLDFLKKNFDYVRFFIFIKEEISSITEDIEKCNMNRTSLVEVSMRVFHGNKNVSLVDSLDTSKDEILKKLVIMLQNQKAAHKEAQWFQENVCKVPLAFMDMSHFQNLWNCGVIYQSNIIQMMQKLSKEPIYKNVVSCRIDNSISENINIFMDSQNKEHIEKKNVVATSINITTSNDENQKEESYHMILTDTMNKNMVYEKMYTTLEESLFKHKKVTIASGKYKVVLHSSIVNYLLKCIIGCVCNNTFENSFLNGKIGQSIFKDSVFIYNNPTKPSATQFKYFDQGGIQMKSLPIVEEGVLKNTLVSESFSAINNVEINAGEYLGEKVIIKPCLNPSSVNFCSITEYLDEYIYVQDRLGGDFSQEKGTFSFSIYGTLFRKGVAIGTVSKCAIAGYISEVFNNLIIGNFVDENYCNPEILVYDMNISTESED